MVCFTFANITHNNVESQEESNLCYNIRIIAAILNVVLSFIHGAEFSMYCLK